MMTQELFVFVKPYKDRYDEFCYILNNNVPACKIKEEWSNFVELSIEPVGWQAIWKMSRDSCLELKINFPFTVVITVQHVNFKDLSCMVFINEVEDENICLPEMVADVPLVDLYPTIEQDNNCVLSTIFETARAIDSLRFFYNHLWMPWDLDYDEGNPWVSTHLEGRLKLHFALMERKLPLKVADTVRKLVNEGRKIQKEIVDVQDQIAEEMEVDSSCSRLLDLTELHNRMHTLKDQYEIHEKPELLKVLVQRAQNIEKFQLENENCESVVFVVLTTSSPEQLSRLAKLTTESKLIRFYQALQETLVNAPANASVLVVQGEHPVHDLGNLELGGTIRGVEPGVMLTEETNRPSGWSLLSGSLTMICLGIHMTSVWNMIKVRPGAECTLREVTLEGASVTDGLDVFPGAKLMAINCHFVNCRTAVACDTTCTVVLTNCTFTNNNVAIEVKEGCSLNMDNCTISDSKRYGINVVLKTSENKNASGSVNSVPGLKESGTTFKNNATDYHFDTSSVKLSGYVQSSDSDMLSASR